MLCFFVFEMFSFHLAHLNLFLTVSSVQIIGTCPQPFSVLIGSSFSFISINRAFYFICVVFEKQISKKTNAIFFLSIYSNNQLPKNLLAFVTIEIPFCMLYLHLTACYNTFVSISQQCLNAKFIMTHASNDFQFDFQFTTNQMLSHLFPIQ